MAGPKFLHCYTSTQIRLPFYKRHNHCNTCICYSTYRMLCTGTGHLMTSHVHCHRHHYCPRHSAPPLISVSERLQSLTLCMEQHLSANVHQLYLICANQATLAVGTLNQGCSYQVMRCASGKKTQLVRPHMCTAKLQAECSLAPESSSYQPVHALLRPWFQHMHVHPENADQHLQKHTGTCTCQTFVLLHTRKRCRLGQVDATFLPINAYNVIYTNTSPLIRWHLFLWEPYEGMQA